MQEDREFDLIQDLKKVPDPKRLQQQMQFALEIDKEKNIFRQTHLAEHGRREDDAEETSYATLKARDPSRKPKAFVDYDPLDTAAAASFLNGNGDADDEDEYADDGDWEDNGRDTVTVETVLTALRVANSIQPITVASLDYWLNRMQTSLAELQVTAEELIAMI